MLYMLYMEVCMRNIKKTSWRKFKTRAANRGMSIGEYFDEIVEETKDAGKNPWDRILNRKRVFTDKELKEMEERMKEFRKDFRFR